MSLFPEVDEEIKLIKEREKKILENLIKISSPYRPLNGTEGVWFEESFCARCNNDDVENEKYCTTLANLHIGEVKEIRHIDNYIFCLKDSNFKLGKLLDNLKAEREQLEYLEAKYPEY